MTKSASPGSTVTGIPPQRSRNVEGDWDLPVFQVNQSAFLGFSSLSVSDCAPAPAYVSRMCRPASSPLVTAFTKFSGSYPRDGSFALQDSEDDDELDKMTSFLLNFSGSASIRTRSGAPSNPLVPLCKTPNWSRMKPSYRSIRSWPTHSCTWKVSLCFLLLSSSLLVIVSYRLFSFALVDDFVESSRRLIAFHRYIVNGTGATYRNAL
mmetsp:Transcript_13660/g.31548  ORF Transcript_13660/g.31548 Transcript_13660/m.31548 type:complete len:208 (-) Transcript_13660:12-635(-)